MMREWKWWPISFALVAIAIIAVACEQHRASEKYQAQSQADCVALAISPEERHTCAKEAQNRKDYTPWGYELVAWPDGITTWAIIATGFAIFWQGWETRKAAEATRDSVRAAKRQADLMEKTLTLQFRPKIAVRAGDIRTSTVAEMGEMATGTLEFVVANTGGSKAEIIAAEVQVVALDLRPGPLQLFKDAEIFGRIPLPAGEAICRNVTLSGKVNEAIRYMDSFGTATIGRASKQIFFIGVIWYDDDIGIRRSMGFYRQYDAETKRFVRVDNDDREYND